MPAERTPNGNVQLRRGHAEDLPRILDLIRESMGAFASEPSRWAWKHEQNPFGRSPVLLAEANGEIVGLRVFMRWRLRAGEQDVRAVRAVDTATHRDWRGKGIFRRLTVQLAEELASEGVGLVFNTPNPASMAGYLKMGWQYVSRVTIWVRPRRPVRAMARVTRTDREDAVEETPGSLDLLLAQPNLDALIAVSRDTDRKLHTPITKSYLEWRYKNVPGLAYSARSLLEDAEGAAVVFRDRRRRGLHELTIAELLVAPSATGIRRGAALLRALAADSDADYLVACAARGTSESIALGLAGFVPLPKVGPHFTVRPLSRAVSVEPDFTRWRNWRCAIGDLEIF